MNGSFSELESTKRQKILDAAYKEFAEQGYAGASTNRIVRDAGISKGMLFYYFNSKRELYRDLIEISIDTVKDFNLTEIKWPGDYFERFYAASLFKIKLYHENPHLFNFLARVYYEPAEEMSEKTAAYIDRMRLQTIALFSGDDGTSRFRGDIPREDIIKMTRWIMEGYENELIQGFDFKNMSQTEIERYMDRYREFLEALKKLFYV